MSLGVSGGPRSWGSQTALLVFTLCLSLMDPLSFSSYVWGQLHHSFPRVLGLAWPSSGNRFWWEEKGQRVRWARGM